MEPPLINPSVSGIFASNVSNQDYPPVGSGSKAMQFEQQHQPPVIQSQQINNSNMQQLPYPQHQQHQIISQGPNMYQVAAVSAHFLLSVLLLYLFNIFVNFVVFQCCF